MGINNLRKAIFLDRDGVLNKAIVKNKRPYSPTTLDDLIIPEEVCPALNSLKEAGYLLICVSNQPDVARGKITSALILEMNNKLCQALPLDEIKICYHDDNEGCLCRKPLPGLLLEAARDYDINLPRSYMVGDRWRDIDAGKHAGCQTILIQYHYDEKTSQNKPDYVTDSLSSAAKWILSG